MSRIFRPAEPSDARPLPQWKIWRGLLYVAMSPHLERVVGFSQSPRARRFAAYLVVLVGLVLQIVLLLVAGYLIDLSISLMEIWADLARKHLELTL